MKKLAILTLATLLSSCTGGSSPAPTDGGLTGETAAQLTTQVQQATQGLHDCVVPIGVSYEASGDLQCVLDGKPVRFLSFAPPASPRPPCRSFGTARFCLGRLGSS